MVSYLINGTCSSTTCFLSKSPLFGLGHWLGGWKEHFFFLRTFLMGKPIFYSFIKNVSLCYRQVKPSNYFTHHNLTSSARVINLWHWLGGWKEHFFFLRTFLMGECCPTFFQLLDLVIFAIETWFKYLMLHHYKGLHLFIYNLINATCLPVYKICDE
jgi:hypothetical protein